MRKTTMALSRAFLVLIVIAACCTAADGALSWGTFLGADWRAGEENMRNDLSVFLKNTQRICAKDVEKLCQGGRYVAASASAYTDWTHGRRRHMYKRWSDVPIGFGPSADGCLHRELERYQAGEARRLIPKCVEWMEKTEGQFEKVCRREKGNDRREAFVVFSTVFATAVSAAVGYMLGAFLRERDDIFSYHNRAENKRILLCFGAAISLPVGVILWASPRLLGLMAGAFGIGRLAQLCIQRRQESQYLAVPASDSGLVFAAIPVQMD